jgi:hypothetical protein
MSDLMGACAKCLKDDIPGSGFVNSQLQQFLKEQTTERGRSQFADARGFAKRTYVQGEQLICRACALEARDVSESEASRHWSADPSMQLKVSFLSRPFDLACCGAAFGYVIEKEGGSNGTSTKIQPGWRIATVGGVDLKGEPQAVVQACLEEADLPVEIEFEQPTEPWSMCGDCKLGKPGGSLSPAGKCAACQASFFDQSHAEVADSWEDF